MNIKKNIWALAAALLFATAFTNCSDWTEVEAEKKVEYGNTETSRPESYYQALREWKRRIIRFRSGGSAAGAILPF